MIEPIYSVIDIDNYFTWDKQIIDGDKIISIHKDMYTLPIETTEIYRERLLLCKIIIAMM